MKSVFRTTVLVAALFALGGCSMFDKKEPPACPRVSILADAAKLTKFRPGQGRDITDVEVQAEFTSYHGSCQYDWDKQIMTLTMQIGIDAQRGPGAKEREIGIAYFVAVPAFYPNPKGKLVNSVPLVFPADTDRVRYTDQEVELSFPVRKLDELAKYEVFLGLQLDQAELDYNRQQKGPM